MSRRPPLAHPSRSRATSRRRRSSRAPSRSASRTCYGRDKLLHYNAATRQWEDITIQPVMANQPVCGYVNSLSPFVINATPELVLPPDLTVEAANASGAAASYVATAVDAEDGSLPANCTPVSGSHAPARRDRRRLLDVGRIGPDRDGQLQRDGRRYDSAGRHRSGTDHADRDAFGRSLRCIVFGARPVARRCDGRRYSGSVAAGRRAGNGLDRVSGGHDDGDVRVQGRERQRRHRDRPR